MMNPENRSRLNQIPASESLRSCERLKPGYKLLLAGPGFLGGFAFKEVGRINEILKSVGDFDEALARTLLYEYFSIHSLFSRMVGKENIVVIKTSTIEVKSSTNNMIAALKRVQFPDNSEFKQIDADFLSQGYLNWPRDAYTLLDDKLMVDSTALKINGDNIIKSSLGEGGQVLVRKKAILVTPGIWKYNKTEINSLQGQGYRVGYLPFVDETKQKYDFMETHIDGHSTLIEDREGKLNLIVADSYSRQGNNTRKFIRRAAETIGAEMIEVDDRNLPPLAFNVLQFEDNSIAMTNSKAKDLELTIYDLVGNDKVFTTEVPLINVPKLTLGGIRCLTNTIPNWVLNKYN